MITITSNHVKERGITLKGIVHLRTPYTQRNMGSSFWRGGAVREGALKNVVDWYSVAIIKEELLLNICHEGYPDLVRSLCDEQVLSKNFHCFNFRIFGGIRYYFYTQNSQIYGTLLTVLSYFADSDFALTLLLCFMMFFLWCKCKFFRTPSTGEASFWKNVQYDPEQGKVF